MRRSLTIIFSLTIITLTVFLGTLKVLALPSESLANLQQAPDLSGKNIYFSEGFGEPSQFDRSDKGISRYASLLHLMGANLFVLDWRQGIPANADLSGKNIYFSERFGEPSQFSIMLRMKPPL